MILLAQALPTAGVKPRAISTLAGDLGTRELIDFARAIGVSYQLIAHAGLAEEYLLVPDQAVSRAAQMSETVTNEELDEVVQDKADSPLSFTDGYWQ